MTDKDNFITRNEFHQEYAGEISINDFSTHSPRAKKPYRTHTESEIVKKIQETNHPEDQEE